MESLNLVGSLQGLKSKLETIGKSIENQITETQVKENIQKKLDQELDNLLKSKDTTINLNIGGKMFKTKISTMKNIETSLFAKLINDRQTKNTSLTEEIFFDRSYTHFGFILEYLRTKSFSLKGLTRWDKEDILLESEYYGLNDIVEACTEACKEIEIIAFEYAGQYSNGGTNRLEDISDRNLLTGFCITSPGWIILELNNEHEIQACEVGGYNGNTGLFAVSNGANAKILTSLDKITWTEVGKTPSNHGNTIQIVKLIPSVAKYIKINHTSYLGVGFVKFYSSEEQISSS